MAIKPVFPATEALKANLRNLSIAELKQARADDADLLLVDIREIQETIELGTIPGAVHVPRGMLEFWADPVSPYYRDYFREGRPIVLFCAGGGRSVFAAKALLDMGFADVGHLEVGFNGWKKAGETVEDVAASSRWMRKPQPAPDARPQMAVGHVPLFVADIAASADFFAALGLRHIGTYERVAILELRGGTHLVVLPAERPLAAGARAPFDLMVDDVDACHATLAARGLQPSAIRANDSHRQFDIVEPGGHRVSVISSHASGQPV